MPPRRKSTTRTWRTPRASRTTSRGRVLPPTPPTAPGNHRGPRRASPARASLRGSAGPDDAPALFESPRAVAGSAFRLTPRLRAHLAVRARCGLQAARCAAASRARSSFFARTRRPARASPHRRAPAHGAGAARTMPRCSGRGGWQRVPPRSPRVPGTPAAATEGRARVSRRCWPGSRPARLAPPVAAPHTAPESAPCSERPTRETPAPATCPRRPPCKPYAGARRLRRPASSPARRPARKRPREPPARPPPRPPVITVRSRVRASPPAEPNPHPRAPHRCTPLKHDIGRARPPQAGNPARPRRPCAGTTGFRTLQCHPPRHTRTQEGRGAAYRARVHSLKDAAVPYTAYYSNAPIYTRQCGDVTVFIAHFCPC